MEQTFEEYLKQARWDFAKVAETYPVEKHLQLRTAIDSLLIAYDQAVAQALSLGAVMPRLFAITAQEGWSEMFWDKEKAQHKIDTQYKKDFPNDEFWVEEVNVS